MEQYKDFIYYRTYSRWIEELKRRETWKETVTRYLNFFEPKIPGSLKCEFYCLGSYIFSKTVMPSMRCLWSAGEALKRENVAGYNCAYTVVDSIRTFSEILYILLCGTGVGFSVERQYINQLPTIPSNLDKFSSTIVFEDSKQGWAEGYLELIKSLYAGGIPNFDYSKIRPKGARLKTFGGRASGPEPLKELCNFTIQTFQNAKGRKLNSLEIFDIVCKISSCVQVGGVRRSATICLTNLSDQRMRHAKEGEWWRTHPHRAFANISVAYTEKPSMEAFTDEWFQLMRAKSGERGIVNREGFIQNTDRILGDNCGVNPCGEIILRNKQFCNLSEVIVKPDDNLKVLTRKVEAAVLFGILQATLTDFQFLSPEWKQNCEAERLIGVSLSGVCDNIYLKRVNKVSKDMLIKLSIHAEKTAKHFAKILGINTPTAYTCVKPSGTVSQLVNCASGLHPRFAEYYLRRVRVTSNDPIAGLLADQGVPWKPEVGETVDNCNTMVFEFPLKSPQESITRKQRSALEQLEFWKMYKVYWCSHNPSVTIYVKDHEWLEVGAWVYKHWDIIGGLSFLPYDGGNYPLMPYEEITKEEYEKKIATFTEIDFSKLSSYETEDKTQGFQEYACTGGACEL